MLGVSALAALGHFAAMGWFGAAGHYDFDETTWVHEEWKANPALSHPATWSTEPPTDRWSWCGPINTADL